MTEQTEPWANLRHTMSHLYVFIENATVRYYPSKPGGFASAELDLPHAREFQADLNRRINDLERADEPRISPDDDYDTLYSLYKEHLQKEMAYRRETAVRAVELERRTLLFQKYLQPHWDALAAAKEAK